MDFDFITEEEKLKEILEEEQARREFREDYFSKFDTCECGQTLASRWLSITTKF